MEYVQDSAVRSNVADLVKGVLLQEMRNNPDNPKEPRELLQEKADKEKGMLEKLRDFIREKGNEIKWTGEYIAAVIGVDRTPHADLVRRCSMTRSHFMMMKRDMNKGHENNKRSENNKRRENNKGEER